MISPAYGTLTVPAGSGTLAQGQSVEVTGSLVAAQGAGEGRQLFGALRVLSERGALLGTGNVLVTELVEQPAPAAPVAG